jgi:hypothetical protein
MMLALGVDVDFTGVVVGRECLRVLVEPSLRVSPANPHQALTLRPSESCRLRIVGTERKVQALGQSGLARVMSDRVSAPEPVDRAAHRLPVRGRLEGPERGLKLRGVRHEGPFELVQRLVQLS